MAAGILFGPKPPWYPGLWPGGPGSMDRAKRGRLAKQGGVLSESNGIWPDLSSKRHGSGRLQDVADFRHEFPGENVGN